MRGAAAAGVTGGPGLGATTLVARAWCLRSMILPLTLSTWRRMRSTACETEAYISVVSALPVSARSCQLTITSEMFVCVFFDGGRECEVTSCEFDFHRAAP